MLFRVDAQRDFKARSIFRFPNSADVPWQTTCPNEESGGGLAVRDGRIYYAVSTPSSWLRSSFVADTVDAARCRPMVWLARGHGRRQGRDDKNYDFYAYDELMELWATFCCERTPAVTPTLANTPLNSRSSASFGPAPNTGLFRGSVVLAFSEPVPVGSVLVPDGGMTVLAMRPGKRMPTQAGEAAASATMGELFAKDPTDPKAGKDPKDTKEAREGPDSGTGGLVQTVKEEQGLSEDWVLLRGDGPAGRPGVVQAPPGGLKTTALRFNTNRMPYGLVMGHRLRDVAPSARLLFREGEKTPAGGWSVTRNDPAITEFRPAVVAIAWPEKLPLRGITLVRPPAGNQHTQARFVLERWVGTGPCDSPKALDEDASWRVVKDVRYDHDPAVHQIDFGGLVETAALRLRFLTIVPGPDGKFRAGFDSIVAYQPAGGDPSGFATLRRDEADLPADLSQRISVLTLPPVEDDKAEAKVERHIPLPKPGSLAFDAAGTLHCVSDGQVVTVPLVTAKSGEAGKVVVARDQLELPLGLAFGSDGKLYVSDNGPKVVKVFDPATGKLVRTIGQPGGLKVGRWDPTRLSCPTGLAVDRLGRAWVADWCWAPKRVQRYAADGKCDKEFLGPTQYGGGGTMDARDRRVIYYAGMKFLINWDDHTWRLDSLLGQVVDRTVYWKDKRYLVGPTPGGGPLVSIAEEGADGTAKLLVQAGYMAEWKALREVPALRDKFGGLDLGKQLFVWSDLNGDRTPQVEEVQVRPLPNGGRWTVGEDLSLVGMGWRLAAASFRPDGVPVYDLAKLKKYNANIRTGHNDNPWGDEKGRTFMTGARLIADDGNTILWEYYNQYNHHDGFYATPFGHNRPGGVLNQEHSPIGHIHVGREEFFITNSDAGDWFCYTGDGMLAGCILGGPAGYGKKAWSMPQWEPGKVDLSDMRPGQEHYQGCVVSPAEGQVYAVAGHNHASVVRVEGLERLQRLGGELAVSADDVEKTRLWRLSQTAADPAAAAEKPKVAKMLRVSAAPDISGSLEEWPEPLLVTVAQTVKRGLRGSKTFVDAVGALGFDATNLYVAMRVRDDSPLKNSAQDPLTLFKSGDAVDVTLGLDPAANPKRKGPVAGDVRLVFAVVKGKCLAVLYKPVDPTAGAELRREFSSPVGRTQMDRAAVIADAKVAAQVRQLKDGRFWELEASVPWSAIGCKPPAVGTTIRGDLGYLQSDEAGTQTIGRRYWSAVTQTVISDLPSEARLNPSLWGSLEVVREGGKLKVTGMKGADGADTTTAPAGGGAVDIESILNNP
jgi:sugar lactone lactonase YvrE